MEKNRFRLAREMAGNKSLEFVAQESESGVSKNTIWKLERDMVDAGFKVVGRLAKYYNVNSAWLVGTSESPSLNEDIQMITDSTGLSDKAICAVKEMKDSRLIETLNLLLESEEFQKMVRWFKTARLINQNCTDEDRTSQIGDDVYQGIIEDTDGKEFENTWFPGEIQVDICLWRASKEMDKAYSKIMEEEKDNGTH